MVAWRTWVLAAVVLAQGNVPGSGTGRGGSWKKEWEKWGWGWAQSRDEMDVITCWCLFRWLQSGVMTTIGDALFLYFSNNYFITLLRGARAQMRLPRPLNPPLAGTASLAHTPYDTDYYFHHYLSEYYEV